MPDYNYNSFFNSQVTTFVVIASGGWSAIFYRAMRLPDVSPIISAIFYYSMYIGGKNILFQLFLAILLNDFDERSVFQAAESQVKSEIEQSLFSRITATIKKVLCCYSNKQVARPEPCEAALDD